MCTRYDPFPRPINSHMSVTTENERMKIAKQTIDQINNNETNCSFAFSPTPSRLQTYNVVRRRHHVLQTLAIAFQMTTHEVDFILKEHLFPIDIATFSSFDRRRAVRILQDHCCKGGNRSGNAQFIHMFLDQDSNSIRFPHMFFESST